MLYIRELKPVLKYSARLNQSKIVCLIKARSPVSHFFLSLDLFCHLMRIVVDLFKMQEFNSCILNNLDILLDNDIPKMSKRRLLLSLIFALKKKYLPLKKITIVGIA